jgi:hypothetical protein
MSRTVQMLLLTGIVIFIFWKGIIPAFREIETDFPNYYTASRLVLEGQSLDSLYNDAWFQRRMAEYGISVAGKFSPFPPPTALVMIPLARLDVLDAQRVWTLVNVVLLVAFVFLLSRILCVSPATAFLLTGMSGLALANNFRFGQWYLVIAFAMAYSFRKYREGNQIAPGIAVGLTGIVKYFPFVFLMIPLMRKEFRAIWMCLLATIIGILCTMTLTGSDIFIQFVSGSAIQHASGLIQDPFSATFQSWGSLSRRLFVFDAGLNSHPLLDSRALYLFFHYGMTAIVALATLRGVLRLRRFSEPRAMDFQFVLLCVGGLLASPATATYHMLILVLPVGILLTRTSGEKWWNIFFALSYAGIGFLPYSLFRLFEGRGILSIFAYPRLWLLSTLFVGIMLYAEHALQAPLKHAVITEN